MPFQLLCRSKAYYQEVRRVRIDILVCKCPIRHAEYAPEWATTVVKDIRKGERGRKCHQKKASCPRSRAPNECALISLASFKSVKPYIRLDSRYTALPMPPLPWAQHSPRTCPPRLPFASSFLSVKVAFFSTPLIAIWHFKCQKQHDEGVIHCIG